MSLANNAGWLGGIFASAILYGLIAKSAAQAFSQSTSFQKVITHLVQRSQIVNIQAFLGIVYFIQAVVVMAYAASCIAAVRRDEAEGFLDNFLAQPISRFRFLSGRLLIIGQGLLVAGLLTTAGLWLGLVSQHSGISISTLLLASTNMIVPAFLIVGFGLFAFGFLPRLTSILAFGVLSWSFLIEIVSSGIQLNHWILDTSILYQISLAPAVSTNWLTDIIMLGFAIIMGVFGFLRFNNRDIEN